MKFDRLHSWSDWSLPGILYKLEGYNGWWYRLYHPHVLFSMNEKSIYAENLQKFLDQFPSVYVKVDGYPGEKTSEAFNKVTGFYLYGDPRATT